MADDKKEKKTTLMENLTAINTASATNRKAKNAARTLARGKAAQGRRKKSQAGTSGVMGLQGLRGFYGSKS
tara:strand:+ start:1442 stop:1654 length:213 start_codon:yes stop_codon:yes gene_type:complete